MSETKQELAAHSGGAVAQADSNSGNLLAMVIEAARDPDVDATKMQAMANLAIQLQDRERETEFNRAKAAAIMEMPSIRRDGVVINHKTNQVQSRYSKWENLQPIIMPILHRHGLVLTHKIGNSGQLVTVQPVLQHVNGFVEVGGEMALPIDTTGSKNGTQGAGSAATYGQRHSTIKLLNIVTHEPGMRDDDGAGASGQQLNGYDALAPDKRQLVDEGRTKSKDGTQAYADWFKGLPKDQAGWLAYNESETGETWHAQNKRAAAAFDGN